MKSDMNGCSTCPPGQEQWEEYRSPITRKMYIQYEYRTQDGALFSCVAPTLDVARTRRSVWLSNQARKTITIFVAEHCVGQQYDSCVSSPCRYASTDGCSHPLHPKHQHSQ